MPPQCQEVVVGRDRLVLPAQDLLPKMLLLDYTWLIPYPKITQNKRENINE